MEDHQLAELDLRRVGEEGVDCSRSATWTGNRSGLLMVNFWSLTWTVSHVSPSRSSLRKAMKFHCSGGGGKLREGGSGRRSSACSC